MPCFFSVFDREKKGYIAAGDLRHVLMNLGDNIVGQEEINELMKDLDKDGDGEITYEEFLNLVTGGEGFG